MMEIQELAADLAGLYKIVYEMAERIEALKPAPEAEPMKPYGPTSYANLDRMTRVDLCEMLCQRAFDQDSGPAGFVETITIGDKTYKVKAECLS